MSLRARLVMAATAALLAACAAGQASAPSTTVGLPIESPSASDILGDSREVRFQATDGVEVQGRAFGSGLVGVVLAHGAGPQGGQESWYSFAQVLAQHGYRVLTFNFRGTQVAVRPVLWRDVAGAVRYLHQQGVTKVFLIGGSLGAHMVLCAAAQTGVEVAGVVAVSSGPGGYCAGGTLTPELMKHIHAPVLVLAGTRDYLMNTDDAQALYSQANQPKQLVLIDSSDHAAALLTGPASAQEKATRAVLDFLAKYS